MQEFISEEDLKTFEGWLRYQGMDAATSAPEELEKWRVFRGTESLGAIAGYGPKSVGAICDLTAFSGVVEIASGVLGPRDGQITVDLVEPDCQSAAFRWTKIARRVFRDIPSWVVITIGSLCG